jgi:rhomboid protease GluP
MNSFQENQRDYENRPAQPEDLENELQSVRVETPAQNTRPWVTWTLLGISVVVFLLQMLGENLFGSDLLVLLGAKVNELIYEGQIWRLFTPMLLHGSILHIGFNMYALYIIGPGLERYYGHARFLALYLLAGFAGNVLSFILTPAPSLGASTAVFGLIAAQGIFIYKNRSLFGSRSKAMLGNIMIIVVFNLFLGLNPGIDNWGHLGGLIGGAFFAWLSGPVLTLRREPWGFTVEDTRSGSQSWTVFFVVGAFFALLALLKVMYF